MMSDGHSRALSRLTQFTVPPKAFSDEDSGAPVSDGTMLSKMVMPLEATAVSAPPEPYV